MKKLLKEYEVKFVDADTVFDKEDFEQLVGNAQDVSAVKVQHGDSADALEDYEDAILQVNEESGNFELNLVGAKRFVQVSGADAMFLTDKRDVHEVSGREVPVPPIVHDTIDTDSKKI